MSDRFSTARHCHAVLSILLNDLHTQFSDDNQTRRPATTDESLQKKRRLDTPSSTIGNQQQSQTAIQNQGVDNSNSAPNLVLASQRGSMMAPSNQSQFTQPNFEYHQPPQSAIMPWPDPMMSADVGDVFGQVSWEALFQGDGPGWEDWEAIAGV